MQLLGGTHKHLYLARPTSILLRKQPVSVIAHEGKLADTQMLAQRIITARYWIVTYTHACTDETTVKYTDSQRTDLLV